MTAQERIDLLGPVEAIPDDQIDAAIAAREKLHAEMVGWLYRSILEGQLYALRVRRTELALKRRNTS